MSFIADTQTKLDTVARKIQPISPSASDRLSRLSAAVGLAPHSMADAWAASNVQQMIDAHVIAEQMRAQDMPGLGLRTLEWVRNLLIFLPLVLTWYGISNAVSSYSTFITITASNPHADKAPLQLPFLYLWQQGFGGYLPGWLILSKLAFYDFLMLLLLVLLTGIVNIRTNLRASSKEQEAETLQEELTDALADAALCLANQRGLQLQTISSVDISQQLLNQMEKERLHREQELASLKTFTDALVPTGKNMLNGARAMQQSTDQMRQVLQHLTASVQQIANDQQRLLTPLGQLIEQQSETNQSVKQLVNDQQTWSQSLEKAIQEAADRLNGRVNGQAHP